MSTFNFGTLATTQVTSNNRRLKPFGIYKVKYKGVEVREIQGKTDPTKTYKIMSVTFEGEDGYYKEDTFYPTEKSNVRSTYKNKEGHEKEMPSPFEQTMTYIAQLVGTLNPEGFVKMQEASSKFKSFDDVVKAVTKVLSSKVDTECYIKLVGREYQGRYNPTLPMITGLSNDGNVFTSDNFISLKESGLSFSAYEEKNAEKYLNHKPTDMKKVVQEDDSFDDPTSDAGEDNFEEFI